MEQGKEEWQVFNRNKKIIRSPDHEKADQIRKTEKGRERVATGGVGGVHRDQIWRR